MANPFQIRWLAGWWFQVIHEGGRVLLEARGYGICLRRPLLAGETPRDVADRMIWQEDRRRRMIKAVWQHHGQPDMEASATGSVPPVPVTAEPLVAELLAVKEASPVPEAVAAGLR